MVKLAIECGEFYFLFHLICLLYSSDYALLIKTYTINFDIIRAISIFVVVIHYAIVIP